ncbi:MAG TPA: hypothetical protein VFZ53_20790 [Polyangiaceae bacterium]
MTAQDDPKVPAPSRPPLKERFQKLMLEYGSAAAWVYFGIFALVLVSFATAIKFGVKVEGAAGAAGTWGAAYVATKLTQPLRILATLIVTPAVVRIARRLRGRNPEHRRDGPPIAER